VSSVIVNTLQELNLSYPKVSDDQRKELAAAKAELKKEGD
jgi:hypothetical protein